MRLYLDDDTAWPLLAKLPLTRAIADSRVCVTKNHDDFWILHNLIKQAQGRHPGIFVLNHWR